MIDGIFIGGGLVALFLVGALTIKVVLKISKRGFGGIMIEKHDFKAALDRIGNSEFVNQGHGRSHIRVGGLETYHADVIMKALRLADRLHSGDVSEGMEAVVGQTLDDAYEGKFCDEESAARQVFKAMAAQMIKEVSGETE